MFVQKLRTKQKLIFSVLPLLLCLGFFIAYSILTMVRHDHYESFGYDLGINDQTVWRYSRFEPPLTTLDAFPDKTKLYEHVELVYAFISPTYWIWSTRRMLLLTQAFIFCTSGWAIYLLAKKKNLHPLHQIGALIGYLMFYGVQNALWFDVHSIVFGAAFIAWYLYFLETKRLKLSVIAFLLAITSKENVAFITFAIAAVYFIKRKDTLSIVFMSISLEYLIFIFLIYFPHIIHFKYLYQNKKGLLSNFNPLYMVNTSEKLQTEFYTFFSFGFIPLLNPLLLLPILADLATYFIVGSDLTAAQGLFMHYRITLAPLLLWATILTIAKYKRLNTIYVATYLLICIMFVQYSLHLPLSYFTKSWFWQVPSGVNNINTVIQNYLPQTASVVSQNNITPHISQRNQIYTLYPEKKDFTNNSPCGQNTCDWFHWYDHPEFLIVDTSPEWDARHLLTNKDPYIKGLQNLEKENVIRTFKQVGSTTLYKVLKNPSEIK